MYNTTATHTSGIQSFGFLVKHERNCCNYRIVHSLLSAVLIHLNPLVFVLLCFTLFQLFSIFGVLWKHALLVKVTFWNFISSSSSLKTKQLLLSSICIHWLVSWIELNFLSRWNDRERLKSFQVCSFSLISAEVWIFFLFSSERKVRFEA